MQNDEARMTNDGKLNLTAWRNFFVIRIPSFVIP